uniref:M23 family metallopeptidase n=1 Tax=Ningiella ruwaisensis TaxID=2364274 RepID=UPI0010A074E9|nr:M23 family metallopeptidase [Ningiella ruwaisensis]
MKLLKYLFIALLIIITLGLLIPEEITIPVRGATSNDWNHKTFWFEPWGSSGVHKGIDIFGRKGKPIISATSGIVVFAGSLKKGGNAIAILGPKWRIHYYSHLESYSVKEGDFVEVSEIIGALGDTGNAIGKPPHVHYSILSLIPIPWLMTTETQGWKKMFYLNPHDKLG